MSMNNREVIREQNQLPSMDAIAQLKIAEEPKKIDVGRRPLSPSSYSSSPQRGHRRPQGPPTEQRDPPQFLHDTDICSSKLENTPHHTTSIPDNTGSINKKLQNADDEEYIYHKQGHPKHRESSAIAGNNEQVSADDAQRDGNDPLLPIPEHTADDKIGITTTEYDMASLKKYNKGTKELFINESSTLEDKDVLEKGSGKSPLCKPPHNAPFPSSPTSQSLDAEQRGFLDSIIRESSSRRLQNEMGTTSMNTGISDSHQKAFKSEEAIDFQNTSYGWKRGLKVVSNVLEERRQRSKIQQLGNKKSRNQMNHPWLNPLHRIGAPSDCPIIDTDSTSVVSEMTTETFQTKESSHLIVDSFDTQREGHIEQRDILKSSSLDYSTSTKEESRSARNPLQQIQRTHNCPEGLLNEPISPVSEEEEEDDEYFEGFINRIMSSALEQSRHGNIEGFKSVKKSSEELDIAIFPSNSEDSCPIDATLFAESSDEEAASRASSSREGRSQRRERASSLDDLHHGSDTEESEGDLPSLKENGNIDTRRSYRLANECVRPPKGSPSENASSPPILSGLLSGFSKEEREAILITLNLKSKELNLQPREQISSLDDLHHGKDTEDAQSVNQPNTKNDTIELKTSSPLVQAYVKRFEDFSNKSTIHSQINSDSLAESSKERNEAGDCTSPNSDDKNSQLRERTLLSDDLNHSNGTKGADTVPPPRTEMNGIGSNDHSPLVEAYIQRFENYSSGKMAPSPFKANLLDELPKEKDTESGRNTQISEREYSEAREQASALDEYHHGSNVKDLDEGALPKTKKEGTNLRNSSSVQSFVEDIEHVTNYKTTLSRETVSTLQNSWDLKSLLDTPSLLDTESLNENTHAVAQGTELTSMQCAKEEILLFNGPALSTLLKTTKSTTEKKEGTLPSKMMRSNAQLARSIETDDFKNKQIVNSVEESIRSNLVQVVKDTSTNGIPGDNNSIAAHGHIGQTSDNSNALENTGQKLAREQLSAIEMSGSPLPTEWVVDGESAGSGKIDPAADSSREEDDDCDESSSSSELEANTQNLIERVMRHSILHQSFIADDEIFQISSSGTDETEDEDTPLTIFAGRPPLHPSPRSAGKSIPVSHNSIEESCDESLKKDEEDRVEEYYNDATFNGDNFDPIADDRSEEELDRYNSLDQAPSSESADSTVEANDEKTSQIDKYGSLRKTISSESNMDGIEEESPENDSMKSAEIIVVSSEEKMPQFGSYTAQDKIVSTESAESLSNNEIKSRIDESVYLRETLRTESTEEEESLHSDGYASADKTASINNSESTLVRNEQESAESFTNQNEESISLTDEPVMLGETTNKRSAKNILDDSEEETLGNHGFVTFESLVDESEEDILKSHGSVSLGRTASIESAESTLDTSEGKIYQKNANDFLREEASIRSSQIDVNDSLPKPISAESIATLGKNDGETLERCGCDFNSKTASTEFAKNEAVAPKFDDLNFLKNAARSESTERAGVNKEGISLPLQYLPGVTIANTASVGSVGSSTGAPSFQEILSSENAGSIQKWTSELSKKERCSLEESSSRSSLMDQSSRRESAEGPPFLSEGSSILPSLNKNPKRTEERERQLEEQEMLRMSLLRMASREKLKERKRELEAEMKMSIENSDNVRWNSTPGIGSKDGQDKRTLATSSLDQSTKFEFDSHFQSSSVKTPILERTISSNKIEELSYPDLTPDSSDMRAMLEFADDDDSYYPLVTSSNDTESPKKCQHNFREEFEDFADFRETRLAPSESEESHIKESQCSKESQLDQFSQIFNSEAEENILNADQKLKLYHSHLPSGKLDDAEEGGLKGLLQNHSFDASTITGDVPDSSFPLRSVRSNKELSSRTSSLPATPTESPYCTKNGHFCGYTEGDDSTHIDDSAHSYSDQLSVYTRFLLTRNSSIPKPIHKTHCDLLAKYLESIGNNPGQAAVIAASFAEQVEDCKKIEPSGMNMSMSLDHNKTIGATYNTEIVPSIHVEETQFFGTSFSKSNNTLTEDSETALDKHEGDQKGYTNSLMSESPFLKKRAPDGLPSDAPDELPSDEHDLLSSIGIRSSVRTLYGRTGYATVTGIPANWVTPPELENGSLLLSQGQFSPSLQANAPHLTNETSMTDEMSRTTHTRELKQSVKVDHKKSGTFAKIWRNFKVNKH